MSHAEVMTVNDSNFDREVLGAPGLHLVDFGAPWCAPCRAIEPIIGALAKEYVGRLRVAQVNVDDNPALAERYGVRSMPTLVLIRDGQVVDGIVGAVPRRVLEERITRALPAT